MNKKNSLSFHSIKASSVSALVLITTFAVRTAAAQATSAPAAPKAAVPVAPPVAEDNTLWYLMIFVLALGLAGAIWWMVKSKKEAKKAEANLELAEDEEWDNESVDADKEMEWLRKNQKLVGKKEAPKPQKKKKSKKSSPAKPTLQQIDASIREITAKTEQVSLAPEANNDPNKYLPIFSIRRVEIAQPFDELPLSNDDSLMDAIEQTYDELEEDNEVRDLAVRILAAFRTRNSVEALTQVALYDLSSNLRSRAVTVLSEFDHEMVFEAILLGCADPTREVRAAAARGLTKLTFDRADAWTRVAESEAEGRVTQAARAAIESGFVDMSFDRLAHPDRKYAYEALTLMALLIKAGETEKIFNALENHRDINVRKAILHVIKVTKDQRAIEGLYGILEKGSLPIELQEEVDKTIEEIGYVTA